MLIEEQAVSESAGGYCQHISHFPAGSLQPTSHSFHTHTDTHQYWKYRVFLERVVQCAGGGGGAIARKQSAALPAPTQGGWAAKAEWAVCGVGRLSSPVFERCVVGRERGVLQEG